jgi:pectate lyase
VSQSEIDQVNDVKQMVTKNSGRMNHGDFTWKFNNETDDTSYLLDSELMSKIINYKVQLVSVGGK